MNDFVCFAHRGASGHAPENTLLAIQKALDMGALWVEVDVYLAKQKLVVIHDQTLERTTNGIGDITKQKISYIRSLDAGNGEKIPFLQEVFDIIALRQSCINVELKGHNTANYVAKLITSYVKEKKINYSQVIVSSFNYHQLLEIKKYNNKISVGMLLEDISLNYTDCAKSLDAYSVHISKNCINDDFVKHAHQQNLKVFVYTINTKKELLHIKQIGADGIFTNYPEICY